MRRWHRPLLCVLVLAVPIIQALVLHSVRAQELAGWVERARIEPAGLVLDAKLDTGAEHSSLHAPDVLWFDQSGADWVRFRVIRRDGQGVHMQRPVVRTVRIKRHGGPGIRRPVVMLRICVGSVQKDVEVNLVDRSQFKYPLLLGRSFLADGLVVDSGRRYTLSPDCPVGSSQP